MTDEELEKEIEKKKRQIADYVRLVSKLGVSPEDEEKQINLMLEDLHKLIKQRK